MVDNIKDQVKASGLSQKSIAKRIGISKEYLNMMLNGKQDLPDKYKIEILSLIKKVS